jgi:hypothetical protein
MDIKEFLLPNDTATDVRASDKTRLLQELTPSSGPPPESISAEIPKGETWDRPAGAAPWRSHTRFAVHVKPAF